MPSKPDLRVLETVQQDIHNGDLLLFRRPGLISAYGRGRYSHAAMAGWWHDTLMCLESREFVGTRATTLASQVRSHPEAIDVFRIWPIGVEAESRMAAKARHLAYDAARRKLGSPYSYMSVLKCAAQHLPLVRFSRKPYRDGDKPDVTGAEHCSQFVASAWRLGAGIDLVPDLADWATEPSDLRRVPCTYLFSLA